MTFHSQLTVRNVKGGWRQNCASSWGKETRVRNVVQLFGSGEDSVFIFCSVFRDRARMGGVPLEPQPLSIIKHKNNVLGEHVGLILSPKNLGNSNENHSPNFTHVLPGFFSTQLWRLLHHCSYVGLVYFKQDVLTTTFSWNGSTVIWSFQIYSQGHGQSTLPLHSFHLSIHHSQHSIIQDYHSLTLSDLSTTEQNIKL